MTDNGSSHSGSLQFYPRVRARKIIPSVNWGAVSKSVNGLTGFIGYKVGMISVWAKDDTANSMTKGKRIVIPATVIECPAMKIYSVRFYKNGIVLKDVVVSNDKDLKKKIKLSKGVGDISSVKDFDDVRIVIYSGVKMTGIGKKKPDMMEIALGGNLDEKMKFIGEKIGKGILVGDVFKNLELVDVRAVTKGYGTQGPVRRFGITLKNHKSEKGVRRPGSLAPWHPARVTFRAPQAGQTGYHSRTSYNNLILSVGKNSERDVNKSGGFKHFGVVKNDYLVLRGSIPGPKKRGIVITRALRPNKFISKKKLEVLEFR